MKTFVPIIAFVSNSQIHQSLMITGKIAMPDLFSFALYRAEGNLGSRNRETELFGMKIKNKCDTNWLMNNIINPSYIFMNWSYIE